MHLIFNNLGDSKLFVTYPARNTYQNLSEQERALIGIREAHLLISSGLEHRDDLIFDILQELSRVS